jgi:prepilin-type N-terminal cleavage/methylation domain-containing protein
LCCRGLVRRKGYGHFRLEARESLQGPPDGASRRLLALVTPAVWQKRESRVRPRGSQRGLTLVELLIALALLGFVLLGIAPLFIASVKSNVSGNEYTGIHMLARDRLEQLMNLPFGDPGLAPGGHLSDLSASLPDPATGLPPAPGSGGVRNPFRICYQVLQFNDPAGVPVNGSFSMSGGVPIAPILTAARSFTYKRIDVTVTSGTGRLGIGARAARVSGVLANPFPAGIPTEADNGVSCP